MKKFNLETGKIGEEIAKDYLEKKGYEIIEQNYKTKYGEIDLVCWDNKEIVIVEVRTKKENIFGTPEDSLDKRKLKKIANNARAYISWKKWQGPYRIDAVCIILNSDNTVNSLNYYENII
jgi:putative endonuclease